MSDATAQRIARANQRGATFYLTIEAGTEDSPGRYRWQLLTDVERMDQEDDLNLTAQELADMVAGTQEVADGDLWRVRVWGTPDEFEEHAEPLGEHLHDVRAETIRRREVFDRVIAVAREDAKSGVNDQLHTDAGFEYGISLADGGRSQTVLGDAVWVHVQNALYLVANEGQEGGSDERQARWFALRDELAGELEEFTAQCRAQRYTGWSNAARDRGHPIRYAN